MTKEELAEKYEAAKQRHAEKSKGAEAAGEQQVTTLEDYNDTPATTVQEDFPDGDSEVERECFVAFARIFSGTLKKGAKLYVLGPKYDPSTRLVETPQIYKESSLSSVSHFDRQFGSSQAVVCEIKDLYLMMGKEFEVIEEVPAGNMLGINGFGDFILKSGTASTSLACPPFTSMTFEAKPIVRVAIEPKQPSQLPILVTGMKLLNQADPCVEVLVQESGEYVIVAAGEVHLQRCLDDLKERFAKIQIRVSEPIVPFRETVVLPPKVDMVNEEISEINKTLAHYTQRLPAFMMKEIQTFSDIITKRDETDENNEITMSKGEAIELRKTTKLKEKAGLIEAYTANKQYCMCLHAKPLPSEVLACFEENLELLKVVHRVSSEASFEDRQAVINSLTSETKQGVKKFYNELNTIFENSGKLWRKAVDKIWAVGPKGSFTNILFNNVAGYERSSVWFGLIEIEEEERKTLNVREYDNNIVSGFQLAVQAGPMCEEPMMGVAFFANEWKMMEQHPIQEATSSQNYGPLSGQYISSFREGCRRAVMAQPMRLMAAMYTCDIQATTEVLGKMYGVLGKREGRILSEDLKEGSDIFDIKAELPVAESFGFAEEIRKKTSGLASPQLVFNRWQVIDVDPFWIPTTEEEYELYGEKADSENQALKYVNKVRKRKGLYVEEKTVEHAAKQRTLKRNK